MDVERLQDEISGHLIHMTVCDLIETCQFIKASEASMAKGKTRRHYMRIVNEVIDELVETESEEAVTQFLQATKRFVSELEKKRDNAEAQNTSEKDPQPEQQLTNLKRQYHAMQEKFQETSRMIEEQIKELNTKSQDSNDSHSKQEPIAVPQRLHHGNLPEVTIRKDFRIAGQIGEKEQKDKLSYTNLMYQIDMGLQKGYPESEIVEAVVKAISPGLSLRGMLEMKNGLTLVQLRRILKSHYKEENASELYQQLINISQTSKETPQNFLFRAIELKDHLLFVSQGEGSDEHFSAELIQKKFLRSVGTGLRSDHIKFQLKQYLDDMSIPDEVLIEKTNEATNMEMEREQKQKKTQPSNSMKGKECQSNVLQCPQEPDVLTTTADTRSSSLTIQQLAKSNSELEKLILQMQKEMIEMKTLLQGSRTR